MPHLIVDKDLCPCESGKLIKDCCLCPQGILRPKPFIPKMPLPKTGLKNPKCYAGELGNCSEKISGEHYISHGILKELSDNGMLEGVEGLPWLTEMRSLPTKRIESNILCKRHNEALSGLDNIAKRFFLSIVRIYKDYEGEVADNQDRVFLFNGYDIERWMLKTLCGFVFSGNASSQTEVISGWKPSVQWVQILFGQASFPDEFGLYFSGRIGGQMRINNKPGFEFAPISNPEVGVDGSTISLYGIKFILVMATPPANKAGTLLEQHIYRPNELVLTNGKSKKLIIFGWNLQSQGGGIVIEVKKSS